LIVASTSGGVKIDAAVVAEPFRQEIRDKIEAWNNEGVDAPLLVGILANKDPAAKQYAEWTGKACRKDGLRYELRTVENPIDVEATLLDANDDPRVHGIIVYYPIFGQEESFSGSSQDDYLRDTVSYKCDVEGLCHLYRTNLYRNIRFLDYPRNQQKCLLPCTALSVAKILEQCPSCYDYEKPIGKRMEGNTVSVINRSEIVGRPLAAMLANDGAKVYSIDINSIYLFEGGKLHQCPEGMTPEDCVRQVRVFCCCYELQMTLLVGWCIWLAFKKKSKPNQSFSHLFCFVLFLSLFVCISFQSSVVVTGVPTKNYRLPTEWVQENTTVINVASFKNVDEEGLLKIKGVVYVPMVGKVTVAMLERNLVRLFEQFHIKGHPQLQQQQQQQAVVVENNVPKIWGLHPVQWYTAAAVTVLVAMHVLDRR